MENPHKQKLLETPMDQFKILGESFTKKFHMSRYHLNYRNYKVPTLSEFIKLNPMLKYDSDRFKASNTCDIDLFDRKSKKWRMLKEYLIENGFTAKDWPMLLPRKKENGKHTNDLLVLGKNEILKLPIIVVCPGQSTKAIPSSVTVSNILNNYHPYLKRSSALAVKRKLTSLGFNENDGPIMELSNAKNRAYYYRQFLNKGLLPDEANTLIDLSVKANLMHFDY